MRGPGVLPGVQIKRWSRLQVPFKSINPLLSDWELGAVSLLSHYSSGVTESHQVPDRRLPPTPANQAKPKTLAKSTLKASAMYLPPVGLARERIAESEAMLEVHGALGGIMMRERVAAGIEFLEAWGTWHCSSQ